MKFKVSELLPRYEGEKKNPPSLATKLSCVMGTPNIFFARFLVRNLKAIQAASDFLEKAMQETEWYKGYDLQFNSLQKQVSKEWDKYIHEYASKPNIKEPRKSQQDFIDEKMAVVKETDEYKLYNESSVAFANEDYEIEIEQITFKELEKQNIQLTASQLISIEFLFSDDI